MVEQFETTAMVVEQSPPQVMAMVLWLRPALMGSDSCDAMCPGLSASCECEIPDKPVACEEPNRQLLGNLPLNRPSTMPMMSFRTGQVAPARLRLPVLRKEPLYRNQQQDNTGATRILSHAEACPAPRHRFQQKVHDSTVQAPGILCS